ncbi:MAG TPA: SAM-dependent methyltransferase [Ktedonobacteraceae bacterium]|nr:SAM-dependent methyltransferase [Ktedonobacteraceae bacterium]
MVKDYKETIKHLVLDEDTFLRLTLKGTVRGQEVPWRRVVVRPVLIKNARHLQFSYFDARQDITKNYQDDEAIEKLDEVLAVPFSSISVQSTVEDVHVQVTKEGRAIFSRTKHNKGEQVVDLRHDASKELPLPAERPDAFLQALGIMNQQGKVLPSMQDKFSQINEFLKLLEHTGELERFEKMPVNMLDCGCGSAYLSFAVYHYLNDVRGIAATLVGVDSNGKLVEKSNLQGQELGFERMCFQKSAIIDYIPDVPPDIVLALHACDTATDEALVQGIQWNARLILSVPCCHHELHQQLQAVAPFKPVFQHGILKKRVADILTDTFRALVLRMMGYKTDVVEFVSSEHTDRNLMIRAVKRSKPGDEKVRQEYEELMNFWGVTPYIEKLMREKGCWVKEESE